MGLLHDIGKMVVPFEILNKPGILSNYEYEIAKTHALVGYEILKEIDFPWPVSQAVLQHHERLDSSGYPSGISGQDIVLEAKVLCVADVVDSMVSNMPYRPGLGIDKALEEITKNKGVLYDPEVVEACLKLFAEKGFQFD
jgi:putative nucleotidyltransferase with HDIG domain